jgi:hypothetical protein
VEERWKGVLQDVYCASYAGIRGFSDVEMVTDQSVFPSPGLVYAWDQAVR